MSDGTYGLILQGLLNNDTFEFWLLSHTLVVEFGGLSIMHTICFNFAGVKFGVEFRYEKYHIHHGGDEEERKANYKDMVRKLSLFDAGWASFFYLFNIN